MAFYHIILPVARSNLVANPSVELDATGWSGTVSANVNRQAGTAQYGAWAAGGTPAAGANSGIRYGTVATGNGTAYTLSFSLYGAVGSQYSVGFTSTAAAGAAVGTTAITTGGSWHRYSLAYTESADSQRFVAFIKRSAGVAPFFVDGVQVEAGNLTTYVDGDQDGCAWLGAVHASASARSGTSRAGGSVVSLQSLGLTVLEHGGVGMPPVANITQSYAIADGGLWQRQRAEMRVFTLTSLMSGTTWPGLHAIRHNVIDALKIDRSPNPQPFRLLYTGAGGTSAIDAYYDGGMSMESRAGFTETTALRLLAPDPYWYAVRDQGTALAGTANLGSVNFIAWRDPRGQWGTFGAAGVTIGGIQNRGVSVIYPIAGGTLIVGGNYTTAGGTRASSIAYAMPSRLFGTLTGGTIHSGAGTPIVETVAQSPNGTIYVGGFWEGNVGGTTSKYAAIYLGGAWGTLGGGTLIGNDVRRLSLTPTGTLLASGDFTGVAGTRGTAIAMHAGGGWGTLAGGGITLAAGANPAAIAGPDGKVYFFAAGAGGTAAGPGLYTWNGAFGTTAGSVSGGGTSLYVLQQGQDGRFYIGGWFTTYAGGTTNSVVAFNGAQAQALGVGVGLDAGSSGIVFAGGVGPDSRFHAAGTFMNAGGVVVSDSFAEWTGGAWVPPDILLPAQVAASNRKVDAIAWDSAGTKYIGGNFAGIGIAAAVNAVVNTGAANAYPVATFRNTGATQARLYQMLNTTTNDSIWFSLTLLPGEAVTLDLRNNQKTLVSTFRGNALGYVLPGSNLTTWKLTPGTNSVSVFASSGSVETSFFWRARSWGADDVL